MLSKREGYPGAPNWKKKNHLVCKWNLKWGLKGM